MTNEIDDFFSPVKKEYQPEQPEHQKYGLFDYINDLTYGKRNLAQLVKEETGTFPSTFVPYIALKAFGNYRDTVLLANEINIRYSELTPEIQYEFFLNALPKRKRFSKFYSIDEQRETRISAVSKYYKCGRRDAIENSKLLSEEQLNEIVRRVNQQQ